MTSLSLAPGQNFPQARANFVPNKLQDGFEKLDQCTSGIAHFGADHVICPYNNFDGQTKVMRLGGGECILVGLKALYALLPTYVHRLACEVQTVTENVEFFQMT